MATINQQAFRVVHKSRVSEQIIEQIRDLITSGRLRPGDRLPPERELAETLQVGRSTVREAMRALESLGLLEVRAGRGAFLAARPWSPESDPMTAGLLTSWDHQHALFEVRRVIEPDLAALAARRATAEQIQRMWSALGDQEAEIRRGETGIPADTAFHSLVAEAAANEILLRIMQSLMERLRETREASLQKGGRPAQSLEQHQGILSAIETRNAKAAEHRMLAHIQTMEDFGFLSMGLFEREGRAPSFPPVEGQAVLDYRETPGGITRQEEGRTVGAEDVSQASKNLGQRRFARFPVSLPVIGRALQASGEEIHGMVWNVGGGGLMAEFPVEIAPGRAVDLVLQTRRGPLEVDGSVVWTSASNGKIRHGVAFMEPKGQEFAVDLFVSESG